LVIYDMEQMRARQAVRLAKQELRRWERLYDRHRGDDAMRYVPEIKAAEERYADAVERLRLLRDGQRRLPRGDAAAAATPPRAPTSDPAGN
jgi:hypothetical protein